MNKITFKVTYQSLIEDDTNEIKKPKLYNISVTIAKLKISYFPHPTGIIGGLYFTGMDHTAFVRSKSRSLWDDGEFTEHATVGYATDVCGPNGQTFVRRKRGKFKILKCFLRQMKYFTVVTFQALPSST